MTGVFLSAPRYDRCAPLSHPFSCMLVNYGPSQQNSKEEYKPWKLLRISYKDHVTNEEVRVKIQQASGPHKDFLTSVKSRKLQWYGHIYCSSGLAKTILQGTVKGGRKGRQRKRWEDNIGEWTGLEFAKSQRAVENREKWRKLVVKSSVVPQRPLWLRDRWWWWWLSVRRGLGEDELERMRKAKILQNSWQHVKHTKICNLFWPIQR